jgi:hypothetical protein
MHTASPDAIPRNGLIVLLILVEFATEDPDKVHWLDTRIGSFNLNRCDRHTFAFVKADSYRSIDQATTCPMPWLGPAFPNTAGPDSAMAHRRERKSMELISDDRVERNRT